jgi:hypothetical protein
MDNRELKKSITTLQKQLNDLSSIINKNDTSNSSKNDVSKDAHKSGGENITSRFRKSVM